MLTAPQVLHGSEIQSRLAYVCCSRQVRMHACLLLSTRSQTLQSYEYTLSSCRAARLDQVFRCRLRVRAPSNRELRHAAVRLLRRDLRASSCSYCSPSSHRSHTCTALYWTYFTVFSATRSSFPSDLSSSGNRRATCATSCHMFLFAFKQREARRQLKSLRVVRRTQRMSSIDNVDEHH